MYILPRHDYPWHWNVDSLILSTAGCRASPRGVKNNRGQLLESRDASLSPDGRAASPEWNVDWWRDAERQALCSGSGFLDVAKPVGGGEEARELGLWTRYCWGCLVWAVVVMELVQLTSVGPGSSLAGLWIGATLCRCWHQLSCRELSGMRLQRVAGAASHLSTVSSRGRHSHLPTQLCLHP